jgi:hypothetical protein
MALPAQPLEAGACEDFAWNRGHGARSGKFLYIYTTLQRKDVTEQLQFAALGIALTRFSSLCQSSAENFRLADTLCQSL